jgi:hypothetical protein
MKTIAVERLEANAFYWARRRPAHGAPAGEPYDIEVVQISTVFGAASEFWTVAVIGTDEYFDLGAYDFFHKVPSPPMAAAWRANLTVISPTTHQIGH